MRALHRNGVQAGIGLADPFLNAVNGRLIQVSRKPSEQMREQVRQQTEHATGGVDRQIIGTGRHHRKRHEETNRASDRNFDHPFECGRNRGQVGNGRSQQNEDRRERSGAEAGIFRSDESDRHQRNRKNHSEPHFAIVRNERADGTGEYRAAERPRQIIGRGLERSADAHLRQDDGRQDRP